MVKVINGKKISLDFSVVDRICGFPAADVDGLGMSLFDLTDIMNRDDPRAVLNADYWLGQTLAVCVLKWLRDWHINSKTGLLDEIIYARAIEGSDLYQISLLIIQGRRNIPNLLDYNALYCFGCFMQMAWEHAVTSRGDPERDVMVSAELDLITHGVIAERIFSILEGNDVQSVVFRERL